MMDTERTIDLLDDNRTEIARLRDYIRLLERAVEASRQQQEREFLLLLPELDFMRLVVLDRAPAK